MIKPDITQSISILPNYINIGNSYVDVAVSGTVAGFGLGTYTGIAPTDAKNNRSDLFAANSANNTKQQLYVNILSNNADTISGVYQHVSNETAQYGVSLTTGGIQFTVDVINPNAGSITLVAQTIRFSIVEYQIPF